MIRHRVLRRTCAAVFLAVGSRTFAQTAEAVPYKPAGASPVRVDLRSSVVEAPLLLLGSPPRVFPVVEALVNGRGPYRFAIETGAEFATVSPKLASDLALPVTGEVAGMKEYRVDSLSIGGATFHTFTVSELRTRAGDIDGLLGLPIYGDLLLTLDYPGKVIRFERGTLPTPDGRTVLALTKGSRGHFWRLPLTVSGFQTLAVIDTRSSGGFGVTPSFLDAHPVKFDGELRVVGMASGAAIAPVQVKAGYLADDVRIGAYTFPKPLVDVRPLPPGFPEDPIVGTQVLQHFVMTLDQKHARIRLAHTGANVIDLPRPDLAGRGAPPPAAEGNAAPRAVRLDPADYVGTWGDRAITFEHEQFYLQRPHGPKYMLVATGIDSFSIKDIPAAEYRFVRDASGTVVELRARNQDGQWETVTRAPKQP
jgi:hypothetical protein